MGEVKHENSFDENIGLILLRYLNSFPLNEKER